MPSNEVPPSEAQFPTEFTLSSRTGSIVVTTTELGLPRALSVERDHLRGAPELLAGEILRLCRRSAQRAGVERRAHLRAVGLAPELLALTGLPTAEEVTRQEYFEEQEYETEPDSWLRPI
ncbi:hypothetical protein KP696_19810 [Nocardia seriolae]|nr:hypothetical protein [Nocardia seriolae]MTJ71517.1 hypothetical protein [Nocardia seriolae]MTJ90906.1 hypothetical protein [Nocardia seriolae]MTK34862.1 hypothetical protein [Nocardia seriolae]MTK38939.1 hypothetical protein [Nocardia seriolae]